MDGHEQAAWEPALPPADFAERVVGVAKSEPIAIASRRLRLVTGFLAAAAVAAAVALGAHIKADRAEGNVTAEARQEVRVGVRATAVLEKGAHVAWNANGVTQSSGDVFWRVEPGSRFVVHTPVADVTVKGTCFRVKVEENAMTTRREAGAALLGAAASAAVLVGVYEGKVAVAHGNASVDVAPGETARADGTGVHKTKGSGESSSATVSDDQAWQSANQSLAETVSLYRQRLEAIGAEKDTLEKRLAEAEQKLAMVDGGPVAKKSQYDLDQDDWKNLAKQGIVRIHIPCAQPSTFNYSAGDLGKLGLAPQDAPIIANALGASYKRTWSVMRPLCAQALGGAVDVADKVGQSACFSIIFDIANQKDPAAVNEAIRQVAEIRAGLLPMPGPDDAVPPVLRMYLAMSGESSSIVSDLTQSLGPDDAKKVVFGGGAGCWNNHGSTVGPRDDKAAPGP